MAASAKQTTKKNSTWQKKNGEHWKKFEIWTFSGTLDHQQLEFETQENFHLVFCIEKLDYFMINGNDVLIAATL